MIFGEYSNQALQENGLTGPIWQQAFNWIQTYAATIEPGEHPIVGRDLYANIQQLSTLPSSETAFEVHKQYLDIHYCIEGGEAIGFAPIGTLAEKTTFDTEKDYQLFGAPTRYSVCNMEPRMFAIFFPGEKHMPKMQNGIHTEIKKVVIKIKMELLT